MADVNNLPAVSVLVPIYNVEKYLSQCLDSVVGQTLKNIEIICIDDGSTDSSPKIIKEYAARDHRIKIITKKNSGYGDSMDKGLEAAKGKYIGIVESDDYAEPLMFEQLYKLAEKDKLDVARSEFYYHDNNTGVDTKSNTKYVPHNTVICPSTELSVFYQQPSIWANIYRHQFLNENNINFLKTPGASYQDTSFTFKVYSVAKRFEMIDDAFLHYRTNAGSSSFVGNSKIYCVCDEYDEIERFLKTTERFQKQKDLFYHLKFNAYRWNYFRLISPFDEQFSSRWQKEFKQAITEGDLKLNNFRSQDAFEIKELLNDGSIKKDKPAISIIVPVYNSEQYLRTCLDSLINQTLKKIEIICVNDGSTDNSRKILTEYADKDKRIKIIDKKNGGLSSARNVGIQNATAGYIGFLDSDDWVIPETYEMALRHIDETDIVIYGTEVIGNYLLEKRNSDHQYYRIKYSGRIELTDEIRENIDVSAWNKLYRIDIIKTNEIQFPEGKLYEDYCFFWKYIAICKTAFFDQNKYHRYLRHEGSIMAQTFNGSARAMEHLDILDNIFTDFKDKTQMENHEQRNNAMFLNCFWFAYLNVPQNDRKKVLKKGTLFVTKWNLSGQKDIDALKIKKYEIVDSKKTYTAKMRLFRAAYKFFERNSGSDTSVLRSSIYNPDPTPETCDRLIATTKWIFEHETRYDIERWNTVYDSTSHDGLMNWNCKEGIIGQNNRIQVNLSAILLPGKRCRAYVCLFNCESTCISGIIQPYGRFILGSCVYDGVNPYAISADFSLLNNTIMVYAIDIFNKINFSEKCRIVRIEVTE